MYALRDYIVEPLYRAKHRIRSGQQTLTVTVPAKPAHAGIDPHHKLINRHMDALLDRDARIAEVRMSGRPLAR